MNMYPENDVSEVTSAIAEVFGDESVNHVFGGGIVANGISYSLQHAGSSSMVVPHHTLGVAQNIAAGMHNVQTSGTTIAHVGDGDANYDFTGLQALGNDQANMIVMVYNNRRHLALAHGGQQRGYDASESIATSALPKTNFVKIAEGHGLNAVHVSAEGKEPFQTRLAATLAKAKQNPGITVVEVEMDPPLRIKHSGPALRT
jgi:thiamine pyrophosphate-dependent acetolactate synthase large subunit-like protein